MKTKHKILLAVARGICDLQEKVDSVSFRIEKSIVREVLRPDVKLEELEEYIKDFPSGLCRHDMITEYRRRKNDAPR